MIVDRANQRGAEEFGQVLEHLFGARRVDAHQRQRRIAPQRRTAVDGRDVLECAGFGGEGDRLGEGAPVALLGAAPPTADPGAAVQVGGRTSQTLTTRWRTITTSHPRSLKQRQR